MGIFDNLAINNKIRKLTNYRSDLCDDTSAIQSYNGKIDAIIGDFQSFIKSGSSAVTSKLYDYKEPYQYNDSNLTTARDYIQYEINNLNRQKANSDDGGGGSW